jgi:hypothetical protein
MSDILTKHDFKNRCLSIDFGIRNFITGIVMNSALLEKQASCNYIKNKDNYLTVSTSYYYNYIFCNQHLNEMIREREQNFPNIHLLYKTKLSNKVSNTSDYLKYVK